MSQSPIISASKWNIVILEEISCNLYLQGGYGSRDMGAMMAMLVLAIVPIVIFYLSSQKYIIKGVVAGAVKG